MCWKLEGDFELDYTFNWYTLPETKSEFTPESGWLENRFPFARWLSGRCELFVSGRVSDIFLCRIKYDVHSVTNCGLVV